MDDELIIIRSTIAINPEKLKEFQQSIMRQKSEGVIVLPPYFHVLRAPKDIDVRVFDRNFTL
jgi:hypothetical protein